MEQYISKEFPDGASVEAALLRAKAGGAIDIALSNKAERGFSDVSDVDTLIEGGMYRVQSPTNLPDECAFCQVLVIHGYLDTYAQIAFPYIRSTMYVRTGVLSSETGNVQWHQWVCIGPEIALGIEYRTAERYKGKPIYTMAINTGALGKNTADDIPHGIANVDDIWVAGGCFIESNANKLSIPYFGGPDNNQVVASTNRSAIHRTHKGDVYSITDMVVILKYTKLSD